MSKEHHGGTAGVAPVERENPKPGQRWRHFRTGMLYTIVGIGFHTDNEKLQVIYKAPATGILWIRPLEDFMGTVENGKLRFELIG